MDEKWDKGRILKERGELIGPSCKLFFEPEPLLIVSAKDQYLYDENGSRYLDCISNVQHVGHSNEKVTAAVAKQMGETNCNIRFAHSSVVECARELLRRSPAQLTCCFFCNSGSEANDVAMRLCRDATAGATDFVVLDHAYHGHLSSTMALSPYKFKQMPTGSWNSKTDFVHVVPVPDVYRGIHRLNDQHLKDREKLREAALIYAQDVAFVIEAKIKGKDRKLAGFFLESLQSCGGQIITPPGYLEETARYVRAAGGLVVVDEVQTGFGRAGDAFWSFQTHCCAG